MEKNQPSLNVNWVFGFSKDSMNSVHNLSTTERNALLFLSSHSAVIYDYEHRTQMILQGHCNILSCCAVSRDKRWIVTADSGPESILVIWDSLSGVPVKTFFNPHPNGISSLDISEDSLFIVTLGEIDNSGNQDICIWAWTEETEVPILRHPSIAREPHHWIRFDSKRQQEIVSSGSSSVTFWSWGSFALEGYTAQPSKTDIGHFSGKFTSSIFLNGTGNAITSTSDGYVIVWEAKVGSGGGKVLRTASKALKLVECGINFSSTTLNNYLVLACGDGAVRFYDFFLRLEAWFEDLAAGPVSSVSFALQDCPFAEGVAGAPGLKFWVPDFLVGTTDAFIIGVESYLFDEVRPENRRGTLLLQGIADEVSGVSCHPSSPLVAFACMNGSLQLWNYELKLLMNLREFNSRAAPLASNPSKSKKKDESNKPLLRPTSSAFDPYGMLLAVGFNSGHIKILDVDSLSDVTSFVPSTDPITSLRFSPSGDYLAALDSGNHALLLRRIRESDPEDALFLDASGKSILGSTRTQNKNPHFEYVGRALAHNSGISGVDFGFKEGVEVLVTVGRDRTCIEYDLIRSSVSSGLVCLDSPRLRYSLDPQSQPSCLLWHPRVEGDLEDRFIVGSEDFKLREYNADSKLCRRTTLGPTFGGPLTQLLPIYRNGQPSHFAYSTQSKIIGVGCLPLTGNPSMHIGLVAHPGVIRSLSVSFDGRFIFSSGGSDLSVNMWEVQVPDTPSPLSEEEQVRPFIDVLEGGFGGELHTDIVDYFYYCQIRAQGEDAMEAREVTGTIPLDQLPSLMRAVGHYLSEEDVASMTNEIKYKHFMKTGQIQSRLTLNDFIKLFVNHRPLLPLQASSISHALDVISDRVLGNREGLVWRDLHRLLTTEGEAIPSQDLVALLSTLTRTDSGSNDLYGEESKLPIDAKYISEQILGFEHS